jgi:hypothetical protein
MRSEFCPDKCRAAMLLEILTAANVLLRLNSEASEVAAFAGGGRGGDCAIAMASGVADTKLKSQKMFISQMPQESEVNKFV